MECERKDKWFRGCRFEPRYDREFGRFETWGFTPDMLDALKNQIYVCDVCIRCGKVIKRGE